ncbi:hypothetical protein ACVNP1_04335 [Staphylococcus aureus]
MKENQDLLTNVTMRIFKMMGIFSVIPQMRGGVTDADQLIRLGEVAKKYHVPLVKVTGSQRVGLYGVKKEELPNIWEDLGMRSASAYGK